MAILLLFLLSVVSAQYMPQSPFFMAQKNCWEGMCYPTYRPPPEKYVLPSVYLNRHRNPNDTSVNSNQTESDDDLSTISDQMVNSENDTQPTDDSSTIGSVSSPSTIDSVSLSTNGSVSSSTIGLTSPPIVEPFPFLRVKGRDFWLNQQNLQPSESENQQNQQPSESENQQNQQPSSEDEEFGESNAEGEGKTMGIETTMSTTEETMVTEGQTETDPIMNSSVTESPVSTQMNRDFSSNSSDLSLMRDDITIVSTAKSLIQEIFG